MSLDPPPSADAFSDDPTMHRWQTFLSVFIDRDDALYAGSGFMGEMRVPLSRVLPLIPQTDLDMVADVLEVNDRYARVRTLLKHSSERPSGYDASAVPLQLTRASYQVCATGLVHAARQYNRDVSAECELATMDLRRESIIRNPSATPHLAGKNIGDLYKIAKRLRAGNDATREFLRSFERTSDMLAIHLFLAAHKAGDRTRMDFLQCHDAVALFLRCGDLNG